MSEHRANRLLSESTRILCTLSERVPSKANALRLHQIAVLATEAGSPRAVPGKDTFFDGVTAVSNLACQARLVRA